jgi:hypothetical protein
VWSSSKFSLFNYIAIKIFIAGVTLPTPLEKKF